MKILGVDYGRRKVGLAISEGVLAKPWKILRVNDFDDAIQKIEKEIEIEKPDRVVVGVSEGQMAEETRKFLSAIRYTLSPIPVETFDETLSTHSARELSREAGVSRKKRKSLEDAFAASVMLQNYLDNNN